MSDDKTNVLRIAKYLADGEPVDWDRESSEDLEVEGTLERLRDIESIQRAHRASAEEEDRTLLSQWGALRIIELIGHGGYGDVYRAHDPALDIDVALKLLRPEALGPKARRDDFLNEARKLARVRHLNVLTVHGADEHDGRVGLWTELLQGKTLEEQLREQGPFGAEECALVGIDLCKALAAVHAAGLIHRDVKTANVMREKGGRIVLMDFSSVTENPRYKDPSRVRDAAGTVSGTPIFMAPELFDGEEAGVTSDIYSLGVVLYRLVANRYPVEADDIPELYAKHRDGLRTPLRDARPDLPTAFVQVIERALQREPNERFSTVGEMERALVAALGIRRGPDERADRARGRVSRWAGLAIAAALVASAIGIALYRPNPNAAAFTVEASLFRVRNGEELRLDRGGGVRPGDNLYVEIRGEQEMFVYVFNEDQQDEVFLLFPLSGGKTQNPLPGGARHHLPERVGSTRLGWEVHSSGGKETILVIASRDRLVELEREMAKLPQATQGRPVAITNGAVVSTLRGVGGLSPLDQGQGRETDFLLSGIAAGLDSQPGIWSEIYRLDNPRPGS